MDLYEDEVFTLTPNGDIITLPAGSTPFDFAYAVHTVIGEKLTGAKVNGKMVNLGTTLKSGDTIEIIKSTDKDKGPSRDWITIAKTSRAKSKIKQWYLNYFDWNHDGEVNWWEYFIPIGVVLIIEIVAEIIGTFIIKYLM